MAIFLAGILLPPKEASQQTAWRVMALFAGFAVALLGTIRLIRKPSLYVDGAGIIANSIPGFQSRFCPWSEIDGCQIETEYNMFGFLRFAQVHFKIKGDDADVRMSLRCTSRSEQLRLRELICSQLPADRYDEKHLSLS